jgi:hypothetical protein
LHPPYSSSSPRFTFGDGCRSARKTFMTYIAIIIAIVIVFYAAFLMARRRR